MNVCHYGAPYIYLYLCAPYLFVYTRSTIHAIAGMGSDGLCGAAPTLSRLIMRLILVPSGRAPLSALAVPVGPAVRKIVKVYTVRSTSRPIILYLYTNGRTLFTTNTRAKRKGRSVREVGRASACEGDYPTAGDIHFG